MPRDFQSCTAGGSYLIQRVKRTMFIAAQKFDLNIKVLHALTCILI